MPRADHEPETTDNVLHFFVLALIHDYQFHNTKVFAAETVSLR
jgi:hypothetical protein